MNSPVDSSGPEGLKYYMPLSGGKSPSSGPTPCAFSAPRTFKYSPDTQQVIKEAMRESRLTFSQKNGFESILRTGDALPSSPWDVYRAEAFKHRHAQRAINRGIPVMTPLNRNLNAKRNQMMLAMRMFGGRMNHGRRSLDAIKASGDLDPERPLNGSRKYIPVDKEKEKVRLAHRMAYGKDPPESGQGPEIAPSVRALGPASSDSSIDNSTSALLHMRVCQIAEEVKERLEFLEHMQRLGNGKSYHASIVSEIHGLMRQMRGISPEDAKSCAEAFELGQLDKSFLSADQGGYKFQNIIARK